MSFYPGTPYGSAPDAVNGYRGTSVAVSGTRAYVVQATSTGWDAGLYPTLVVYDISGNVPVVVGVAAMDAVNGIGAHSVAVAGNRAYVVNEHIGSDLDKPALVVYDISSDIPVVVGASAPDAVNGYKSVSVAVAGNRAYVVNTLGDPDSSTYPALVIYDISADIPVVIGVAAIDAVNGYSSTSVAVSGTRAYVANELGGGIESTNPALVVYDISGAVPVVVGAAAPDPVNGYSSGGVYVAVSGTRAYVSRDLIYGDESTYPALVVYDISTDVPVVVGAAAINPVYGYSGGQIAVIGGRAYVSHYLYGVAAASTYPALVVYDISTDIPVVVGAAAPDPVNGYESSGVAVEGDRAYVVNMLFPGDAGTYPALVAYIPQLLLFGNSFWCARTRLDPD